MKTIQQRNHVKIIGQGEQTILLAHGFGCDQSMWQYIAPALAEQYRVVLFDYVGAGDSDITAYHSEKYSSAHGYKQDILDIIDELELKDIHFVGHSVSSMIGMLAAIERPECFKKFVMIGPSPCYINEPGYTGGFEASDIADLLTMMEMNFTGWANYLAPVVTDPAKDPQLTKSLEQSFVSVNPQIAREFAEMTFMSDHRESLVSMTVPTLIIQCSDDSIVPIEVGEYLHAHLPASTLHIMQVKGHYPHMSNPTETKKLIEEFIAN
ncbi:alpha/beta hydrolase [Sporosarcina sp. BI001-red]|uniref:alpha/beta fold hydrolase n=1 Tax=Sporosarcina sp. BI001-red TaxID=2282866 RepID=UPI000E2580E4|nr:alpha/beta hydrolase [Sporosarcina sp. BI001-red]REB05484.1 alpha/beta hydrolase [Sporosarcina sp. BI001-red]